MQDEVGLAFVHGAGLGGWIWEGLHTSLDVPHVFADFPARDGGADARRNLSLDDYAARVEQQVAGLPTDRVAVVAHSLGGVVGLKVADLLGDRLAGFIGVSAAIPQDGGSYLSALPVPQRWIAGALMRVLGTKAPESAIRKGMGNGLSGQQADEVVRRFAPESKSAYFDRCDVPIPNVPRTYVRLTEDNEFDQSMQSAMARNLGASDVPEIAAGHLVMLSKPAELAAVLNDCAAKLAG